MEKLDPLNDKVIDVPGSFSRMISARHILDEGEVPLTSGIASLFYPSYNVDWNADDAYTRAVDQVVGDISEKIKTDPVFQDLMKKETWTDFDRRLWEREVTEAMNDSLNRTCRGNLTDYRNDWLHSGVSRPSSLNRLSEDLENNTQTIENDCDTMAATQAAIMQRVDNDFLPAPGEQADPDDHKAQSTYYVCYGRKANFLLTEEEKKAYEEEIKKLSPEQRQDVANAVEPYLKDAKEGKNYHAHIMSSETGAVIEPTERRYITPLNPDPISDFRAGRPIVSNVGNHYDANDRTFTTDDVLFDAEERGAAVAEFEEAADRIHNTPLFEERMRNVDESMDRLESVAAEAAEDPRMQMLGELMDIAREQGLDQDSFKMMRDIVFDSEVTDSLLRMHIASDDAQSNLYMAALRMPQSSDAARVREKAEELLEERPLLLDRVPGRGAADGDVTLQTLQEMDEPEEYPVRFDVTSMGEQCEDGVNEALDRLEQEEQRQAPEPEAKPESAPASEPESAPESAPAPVPTS